ncbi:DUF2516 family protein [candidate division WS5 bacterium]|uniref:DUF2516 family protein n=1 Tax=candidate division WS5 bacterium TaxID=2093353 RepID=A0A419DG51_9BACT|nr:MAG: DUF2516 family protein [candidate division WS5 bacterium]
MLALLAQATDEFDYNVDVSTGDTAAATGIIAGLGIFFLVFIVIGLALWAFNIWMAIDCATRQESDFPSNNKNMWLILLIVGLFVGFGWIVALVYYFSIKKKTGSKGGAAPTQSSGTDTSAK